MKTISNRDMIASSILLHSQSSERCILQSSLRKITSDLGNDHKIQYCKHIYHFGVNVQYMNDEK